MLLFALFLHFFTFSEVTKNGSDKISTRQTANYDVTQFGMNANCSNFIKADGSLGSYGTKLIAAFDRVGSDCMYEGFNPVHICPNYSTFKKPQKQKFFAFLFAIIAHYESSCKKGASAPGTNDLAVGLFQLEDSKRARKAAGRSAQFCASNRAVNAYDLTFQMECAASTFLSFHCEKGIPPGQCLPGKKKPVCGYWQKLNSPKRAITKTAKLFPGCQG